MKVFNIRDTRGFFETLTECSGDIEIIDGNHTLIPLVRNDRRNLNMIAAVFANAKIDEMELHFENQKDSVRMMEYLVAM